ncbi:MAG: family 3 adenylate cyclase [Acidimicrobiales bacterium]|nr:family 3 adenylate cyclase [Acidimicrobiales bacterium]
MTDPPEDDRPPDPEPEPASQPGPGPGPGPEPGSEPGSAPASASASDGNLVEVLLAIGVDREEIARAEADGSVELLAVEHLVLPDPPIYDLATLSKATGMPAEQIVDLWRSLGFAEPGPHDRIFTAPDADMLHTVAGLMESGIVEPDLTVQMARVIGSSMARVASAVVDAIDPADPMLEIGRDTDFAATAGSLLPTMPRIMDYVWRRHLQAEARRRVSRSTTGADPDHKAVGFADLVGFTALSQQVSSHELAAVVDRFETIAYSTVSSLGGRVVKMIGDEVMFSTDGQREAAEIALTLAEAYARDDELSDVRVGLACGPVLSREADLFGPVVNRASRIVGIAFPGSVVVSEEVHDALADEPSLYWKSIGHRHLKDIGRVNLWVLRRAGQHTPKSNVQKAAAQRTERRERVVEEMAERRGSRKDRRAADPGPDPT